jgi:hypothetical protein
VANWTVTRVTPGERLMENGRFEKIYTVYYREHESSTEDSVEILRRDFSEENVRRQVQEAADAVNAVHRLSST